MFFWKERMPNPVEMTTVALYCNLRGYLLIRFKEFLTVVTEQLLKKNLYTRGVEDFMGLNIENQ